MHSPLLCCSLSTLAWYGELVLNCLVTSLLVFIAVRFSLNLCSALMSSQRAKQFCFIISLHVIGGKT